MKTKNVNQIETTFALAAPLAALKLKKHSRAVALFVSPAAGLLGCTLLCFALLSISSLRAQTVTANNVTSTITVDGNLNETPWSLGTSVAKNVSGSPNNTTTFGVLWNSTYLSPPSRRMRRNFRH